MWSEPPSTKSTAHPQNEEYCPVAIHNPLTETMSKRMQQGTGEEIIVAQSKSTFNLVSRSAASSPAAPSSSASSHPVILRAPSQQGSNLMAPSAGKPVAGGSNQNDAASSSQVWLTDAKLSERARKLAAVDTNQDQSFQERARKRAAEYLDINDEDDSKWPHNLRVSGAHVPHLEKVYSNLRQQLKREAEGQHGGSQCEYDDMENVHVGHPASRSSPWQWLFGESTLNQKSFTKNNEAVVRWNREVCQWTDLNSWNIADRLARKILENDDSVDWPSSQQRRPTCSPI